MILLKSFITIIIICYNLVDGTQVQDCAGKDPCQCTGIPPNCRLDCLGKDDCKGSELICSSGSISCTVRCNAETSCGDSIISANGANTFTLGCEDKDSCKNMALTCDTGGGNCIVNCQGEVSCSDSCINAPQNGGDFTLNCDSGEKDACKASIVICPPPGSGSCRINCPSDEELKACEDIIVITKGNTLRCPNCPDTVQRFDTEEEAGLEPDDVPCVIVEETANARSENGGLLDELQHIGGNNGGDGKNINYTLSVSEKTAMNLWGMIVLFIFVNCICWAQKTNLFTRFTIKQKQIQKEVYDDDE